MSNNYKSIFPYNLYIQELNIDIAKTHLWMKRVSNLLGDDFAKELAATYVKYTIPHTEKDKEGMKKLKHHQLFTPEFNRLFIPLCLLVINTFIMFSD